MDWMFLARTAAALVATVIVPMGCAACAGVALVVMRLSSRQTVSSPAPQPAQVGALEQRWILAACTLFGSLALLALDMTLVIPTVLSEMGIRP